MGQLHQVGPVIRYSLVNPVVLLHLVGPLDLEDHLIHYLSFVLESLLIDLSLKGLVLQYDLENSSALPVIESLSKVLSK